MAVQVQSSPSRAPTSTPAAAAAKSKAGGLRGMGYAEQTAALAPTGAGPSAVQMKKPKAPEAKADEGGRAPSTGSSETTVAPVLDATGAGASIGKGSTSVNDAGKVVKSDASGGVKVGPTGVAVTGGASKSEYAEVPKLGPDGKQAVDDKGDPIYEAGAGSGSAVKGGVATDGKSVTISGSASDARTDKDGKKAGEGIGGSAGYNAATGEYKFGANGQTTNADGSQQGASVGLTAGKGTAGVSVGGTLTDAKGNARGGSAEAKVTKTGGKLGASGSSTNKKQEGVSASGSIEWDFSAVARVGAAGTPEVFWQKLRRVSGGGGKATEDRGVSGELTYESIESGTIPCDDMDKAKAKAKAIESKKEKPATGATAAAAGAMSKGQTWSGGSSTTFTVDASAQSSLGDVGVGATMGSGSKVTVKCTSEGVFEVTRQYDDNGEVRASIGQGVFVSLAGSKGSTHSRAVTVGFDTHTKSGAKNFQSFVDTGYLVNDAYTEISKLEGKSDSTGHSVSALGLTASSKSTTSKETTTTAEGSTETSYSGKRDDSWSMALLGMSASKSNALSATEKKDASGKTKSRVYGLSTEVSGTSGEANKKNLAAATDKGAGVTAGAKASGKWTVTSSFTPEEIDEYCELVVQDHKTKGGVRGRILVPGLTVGMIDELAASVSAAKGSGGRTEALTAWVAAHGQVALGSIHHAIGGDGKPRNEIALAGDAYFTGPAGREALAAKVQGLVTRIESGKGDYAAIAKEAVGEIQKLEQKLKVISDKAKYTDLPDGLRAEEIERTQAFIRVLDGLKKKAFARLEPSAALATKDPELLVMALEAKIEHAWKVERDDGEYCGNQFRAVSKTRARLLEGKGVKGKKGSALQALGGVEAATFASADARYQAGQGASTRAQKAWLDTSDLEKAFDKAKHSQPATAAIHGKAVLERLETASKAYVESGDAYAEAETIYLDLANKYAGDATYKGYF